MNQAFHLALTWIWRAEGIDADDPYDKGGRTRFGIAAAAHPDEEISSLTAERASQIYEREYWKSRGCDLLPLELGIAVFDGEVNHSMGTATKFLQDALRVSVDGIIGPQTAAAARNSPIHETLERYLANRAVYYREIVANDATQSRFLEGWMWRLFRLQRYLLIEVSE